MLKNNQPVIFLSKDIFFLFHLQNFCLSNKYKRSSLFAVLLFADLKTVNNEGKLLFLVYLSLY